MPIISGVVQQQAAGSPPTRLGPTNPASIAVVGTTGVQTSLDGAFGIAVAGN